MHIMSFVSYCIYYFLAFLKIIFILSCFFDDILSEPYDLAVSYELNLLARCFEECKDPSFIKQYARVLIIA